MGETDAKWYGNPFGWDHRLKGRNMVKIHFVFLLALIFASGCMRESSERKAMEEKIIEIAASAMNGKQRYNSLDNLNALLSGFRICKDSGLRSQLAREFAEQVGKSCPRLVGSDYSSFVVEVRRFGLNVGYVVTVLEEFETDAELRLSLCLELMEKYKQLCFTVPSASKEAGEDETSFELRVNSAFVLNNEYADSVASWRRFTFPSIKEKLPSELRGAFDEKCAALLDFPSCKDFMCAPMMKTRESINNDTAIP